MQQTFTLNQNIQTLTENEKELFRYSEEASILEENPSELSLMNILNFSRNLEVQKSESIGTFDYLRS